MFVYFTKIVHAQVSLSFYYLCFSVKFTSKYSAVGAHLHTPTKNAHAFKLSYLRVEYVKNMQVDEIYRSYTFISRNYT